VNDVAPRDRDVAMVFQNYALYPHMSVRDNLGFPLRLHHVRRRELKERVADAAGLLGIAELLDRRPRQLSGGQRQRVATARALALEPKLFLLDEPLSALDANLREDLQVELRLLQQKLGITTIMVTHDQREAMTMSDVVVVMREGKIEQVGAPLEVYRRPSTAFVARFIGTTNLLEGRPADGGHVRVAGRRFAISPDGRATTGDSALLSVRPEDARIVDEGSSRDNTLAGRVVFVRDLGELHQCYVDCGLTDHVVVAASARDHSAVAQGDSVAVFFPPEACVLVRP
jgi:putative spermidine/putrescine transport system ATP-binding protein